MSAKYLNINIGATAGAVFYKGGGSSVLTTQVQGVGSGSPTAAQTVNIIKGFWDAIIASIAQPWNLPVFPSPVQVWGQTYLPASQAQVIPQGQGAANPALSAKTGQPMQVTNGGGVVADVVFVSVA